MGMYGRGYIGVGVPFEILGLNEDDKEEFFHSDAETGKLELIYDEASDKEFIMIVFDKDESIECTEGMNINFFGLQAIESYINDFIREYKIHLNKTVTRDEVGVIAGTFWG